MLENVNLPEELSREVGSESRDFAIKASRAYPKGTSIVMIIFGLVWSTFSIFMGSSFFLPLLQGGEMNFTVNGVSKVATLGNMQSAIFPAIFIGIFVFIGLSLVIGGIVILFKDGGYFVATPTRLVKYLKGDLRSIDWEQFSGDIGVRNYSSLGDITLQLRTGKMVSQKNSPDKYVPDNIFICGIKNVFDVERICRKRIKENDPTPLISNN